MENVQFVNQYEIHSDLLRSWQSFARKRAGKHRQWLLLFSALLLTIVALWFFSFDTKFPEPDSKSYGLLLLFLAAILLTSNFTGSFARVNQYNRISGEDKWLQTLCFGEEIEVKNSISRTYYSYDLIRFIDETADCFFLWIGLETVLNDRSEYYNLAAGMDSFLVVYKDAFTVGDTNEFYSFVSEKCGKKEPLLTKREVNKIGLKKCGFSMIGVVAFVAFYIWLYYRALEDYQFYLELQKLFGELRTSGFFFPFQV